jgi:flagellar biosynthesis chaperone FliJ
VRQHGLEPVRQHGAADVRGDIKQLSYDDIADLFGIERESARHLALRKQWRRTKGNDGKARVEVPLEALPVPDTDERPVGSTGDDTAAVPTLTRHIERLELALEEAQERADEAEAARDSACDEARVFERERDTARADARAIASQVDALNVVLAVERKLVEQARERADDARARVDEVKAERDKWHSAAESAQARIADLTAKAAELEKRRGWWPFRRAG